MYASRRTGPPARLVALAGLAMLAAGAALSPSAAGAAPRVSGNWAGYVASPGPSVGSRFSSVSGSWRQPAAGCTAGREGFSAVWVGLGGFGAGRPVEQVGTDADCSRSGRASYVAWFELFPAGPVELQMAVRPGDRMTASVTSNANRVTLRIRNLTTGGRFSTTRRVSRPDFSTAEWIVEAPSSCTPANSCSTLPLADFGTVAFSSATATARGRTGTISDRRWSATALELQQRASDLAGGSAVARSAAALTLGTPTPVRRDGSFSVSWSERSGSAQGPAPPDFGPGPPQG
jgi:hypothetical protein